MYAAHTLSMWQAAAWRHGCARIAGRRLCRAAATPQQHPNRVCATQPDSQPHPAHTIPDNTPALLSVMAAGACQR
jgi:hypothetical protein